VSEGGTQSPHTATQPRSAGHGREGMRHLSSPLDKHARAHVEATHPDFLSDDMLLLSIATQAAF